MTDILTIIFLANANYLILSVKMCFLKQNPG